MEFDRTALEERLDKLAEKIHSLPGRVTTFREKIHHNNIEVPICVSLEAGFRDSIPVLRVFWKGEFYSLGYIDDVELLLSVATGIYAAVERWLEREADARKKAQSLDDSLPAAEQLVETFKHSGKVY